MTRILVLSILIEALVVVAMAKNLESLAIPTAPTPTSHVKQDGAEALQNKIRRLGKHQHQLIISRSPEAPCSSPSEAPLAKDNTDYPEGVKENAPIQVQNIKIKKENNHHSVDKSVAGAGVILGGLVAAFLFAIARYIRATRRKSAEPTSPTSANSPSSSSPRV